MKVSGIYKIQSISHPERCYIGSAVDINERWRLHKLMLLKNKHQSPILQNHVNKYGIEDFIFSIVLYGCKKEDLIFLEQCFINQYKPKFNSCLIAGSRLGVAHTDKSKKKMSESRKGISRSIKFTSQWCENISISKTGSKRKKNKNPYPLKGIKKETAICPICGKIGGATVMKRFHFENCTPKINRNEYIKTWKTLNKDRLNQRRRELRKLKKFK